MTHDLRARLGLRLPILQAPMAGVSSPAMAAAVSRAGGLGALGLGATPPAAAYAAVAEARALGADRLHVNLFCHHPARADAKRHADWLAMLAPHFRKYGATPPNALNEIYPSFLAEPAQMQLLLDTKPTLASFHFGVPDADCIAELHAQGIAVAATATQLAEARQIAAIGCDAVIAQGWQAGGHRGIFDPDGPDAQQETLPLTRLIATETGLPVIAAGGLMTGGDIAEALAAGATAAQLGTAFIACPESMADAAWRNRLNAEAPETLMTCAISGRPARALPNQLTALVAQNGDERAAPDYPFSYDAAKRLNAAAQSKNEAGFATQWAGMGVRQSRALPAAELVARLGQELRAAPGKGATLTTQ